MAVTNKKGRSVKSPATNRSKKTNAKLQKKPTRSRSGSGGFELTSLIHWPRIIALVLILGAVGGLYVWRSQATSAYKSVLSCGGDVTKALANTACADNSAEAVIYRLYAGGLKRQPDASGFKYWSLELASGKSVQSVATTFISQSVGEPKTTTTTLSNGDFVISMYEKLLGRTPDLSKGGGAYWLGEVNKKGQDTVLASFIATEEVKTKHPGLTVSGAKTLMGMSGKESSLTFVKDLYRYMNNQVGTQADWDYWNNEITSGRRTRASVLAYFAELQTAKNNHRSGFTTYVKANSPKIQETTNEIESKRNAVPDSGSTGSGGSSSRGGSGSGGSSSGGGSSSSGSTGSGSVGSESADSGTTSGPNPHVCNAPYPGLAAGTKNGSDGRKDACVSAVQFNLKKASPKVVISGTVDAPSVEAIKSFQAFFKQAVTGELTPAQVKSIADVWGAYKTDGSGGGTAKDPKKEDSNTSTTGGSGYLDITFMAHEESITQADLDAAINKLRSSLSGIEPFASINSKIAYHTVPLDKRANCTTESIQSADGSFTAVSCKGVQDTVASAGVPADMVFIVSNAAQREHVGMGGAKINPNTVGMTMVHELGHLFDLADEYISYASGTWGEKDLEQYAQCITATTGSNTTPLTDGSWRSVSGAWSVWSSLPGVDWHQGCGDNRWFRPSASSIMLSQYDDNTFNSVSRKIIEDALKAYVN